MTDSVRDREVTYIIHSDIFVLVRPTLEKGINKRESQNSAESVIDKKLPESPCSSQLPAGGRDR